MELTRLSQRTGDDTYYHLALRIQDRLSRYKSQYGSLVPYHMQDDFSSMWVPGRLAHPMAMWSLKAGLAYSVGASRRTPLAV